jgi:DNA-binding IclR family transcriptional regulator
VHLGVVNGDEIIYLIRADSDRPYVMPSRVGLAISMHCTGIGKVVLGSREYHELQHFVVRTGLPARTEHTITSVAGFRTEIADVRRLGHALDREENVPGLGCVAAPIRDHTGTVKYGVSITTPAHRAQIWSRSRRCRRLPSRPPTGSPSRSVTGPRGITDLNSPSPLPRHMKRIPHECPAIP